MRTDGVLISTSSVVLDATAFPVVLATFVGAPSRGEFSSFLDAWSALLCRQESFVVVVDGREGAALPFELISDAVAWLQLESERRQFCRGLALVLPSPVQRAVLGAILRVVTLGEHAVFDDVTPAVSWALRVLRTR
jgi:hypothetical protein